MKLLPSLFGMALLASSGTAMAQASSDAYLGQTITVPFGFCPTGWAEMAGQELPIGQNTALFSLIGTIYGGDGETTFALPLATPKYASDGRMLRQCIALQGIFPSQ